jgi:hypothetical protein
LDLRELLLLLAVLLLVVAVAVAAVAATVAVALTVSLAQADDSAFAVVVCVFGLNVQDFDWLKADFLVTEGVWSVSLRDGQSLMSRLEAATGI